MSTPDGRFPPAITAVTLGVADVERSRTYYAALGWEAEQVTGTTVFVRLGHQYLMLYAVEELGRDMGRPDLRPGSGSVTLARNFASAVDVDAAYARALSAGASQVQAACPTAWGGYSGIVADPDGHLWELAWNPFWPIAADGTVGESD